MIRHASEVRADQEARAVGQEIEKAMAANRYATQTSITIKESSTLATLRSKGYDIIPQGGYSYLVIWQPILTRY